VTGFAEWKQWLLIEMKKSPTSENKNGPETPPQGSGDSQSLLFWKNWPLGIHKSNTWPQRTNIKMLCYCFKLLQIEGPHRKMQIDVAFLVRRHRSLACRCSAKNCDGPFIVSANTCRELQTKCLKMRGS